jgi:acyl transferase domain-containing protein
MLIPDIMGAMTRLHFLSPEGKCQSFDHRGNGYSRGEGAAFCVLKPLHLALKNGDVIRGVIRNTAVNQDGNTPGITVPSAKAQEDLIRRVYREAGLCLGETRYVEAHGTGTPAGDPVEAEALATTFGRARGSAGPLYMGSVKSNIGHLEGASGLVQLVKAVMMLEEGQIPPFIWYEKPNPRIPMEKWNLAVPTELMGWPAPGFRRISINSFGYGGTNAHCIVDDAYHYLKMHRLRGNQNMRNHYAAPESSLNSHIDLRFDPDRSRPPGPRRVECQAPGCKPLIHPCGPCKNGIGGGKLLVLTSHEQAGIARMAQCYREYLSGKLGKVGKLGADPTVDRKLLDTFARTLGTRRSVFAWKSFVIAGTCADAVTRLDKLTVSPERSAASKEIPKIGLVFTGQGAQWYAMGRALYSHPVFRESLTTASDFFATRIRIPGLEPWSLTEELWKDEKTSRLDQACYSQPICTALQVALVDLLRAWNIRYHAVVGHSSGEIAAAYAKGALTRSGAWAISCMRGLLSHRICATSSKDGVPSHGMLATGIGRVQAEEYISRLAGCEATLACINSPSSTTLSGEAGALDALEKLITADGHFARRLRVEVAYHSSQMTWAGTWYLECLRPLFPMPRGTYKRVRMFSSLTGKEVQDAQLGPDYWVSNLVQPVEFNDAALSMLTFAETDGDKDGSRQPSRKPFVQHLIEVGPHSALKGPLQQILADESIKSLASDVTYDSMLQRGQDANETALHVAGRMFQFGHPVDLACVNADSKTAEYAATNSYLVDLPAFSWNHSLKYWTDSHIAKAHRFRKDARKDLFGIETLEMLDDEPRYRNILRVGEVPWVKFHKVQGSILYPAAGMVIMPIEALSQRSDRTQEIEGYELRDVLIGKAIVVPESDDGIETMLSLKPYRHGSQTLTAAWQEFRVYSRKEVWDLNCSGLIRIKYKTTQNPLFADEEALSAQQLVKRYTKVYNDCLRKQNPRQFYEHLTSIGLHYGDIFQNLVEIRKGDFQSACKVKIPNTRSTMPHQYEYPHVIHPATLDAIVQLALPACTSSGEDLTVAMVPTAIGRLYVSASMPTEPDVVLPGFSAGVLTDSGSREGQIILGDSEGFSNPLVVFEGVRSATLATSTTSEAASLVNMRKLITRFQWQEDITLLDPAQIKKLCDDALGDRGLADRKVLEELEMACLIIIKRVMQECPREEAETFVWNFKLFWAYMERCYELGKARKLTYQTPDSNWLDMEPEEENALLARVCADSSDGTVLVELGKHLPAILRGEIPPLQILMHNNYLHNFYKDGRGTERHYAQMAFYIGQLAHKNPNMKILEIGAGTAGASLPALEALGGNHGTAPRFASYTFTDITVGFFEKAREKLAPWVPFMKFARLNIEEDPYTQGSFEEEGYDLILASNVLHATRFIQKTLKNTHKLLKPYVQKHHPAS